MQAVSLGPPQIEEIWDYKISFMAPEGAPVKAGQPVLGFDTSELEQKLQEKMAERDSAQKELEKRQTDLEIARRRRRAAARRGRGPAAQAAPQGGRAARARGRPRSSPSRAQDLALANREIAYLKDKHRGWRPSQAATDVDALASSAATAPPPRVRGDGGAPSASMMVPAPRAGTVVYVATDNGEKKKIGDSCWRGQSVIEIPDLRQHAGRGGRRRGRRRPRGRRASG